MDSTSSSKVKIISKCLVKPKNIFEKSKEQYLFSPPDTRCLGIHYIQFGLLFLKPSHDAMIMETLLQRLKDSLATTLVHFYLLSGRLSTLKTENPISYQVFVDCNDSLGAGFIHAKSDLSVSDIVGTNHVPFVVESFFDHHKALNRDAHTMSLVSVKVTELVDGVFIGLSMNHSIVDGVSFWQFFNSLSEIFNSQEVQTNKNLKNPPIFREVSGATCKLAYDPLDESSITRSESPVLVERMFHFSSETVKTLKSKANQECGTTTMISSLQSLTAFMWRSITRARKLPYDQETTCRFAADTRSRMNPPWSEDNFGNYVSFPKTTTKIGHLLENEFGFAALKVHQAVTELTVEKISSIIDKTLKFLIGVEVNPLFGSNIVHVASSPRFNKYGPEFGMGKAVAIRSGFGGKYDGKILAYPGREGGGSIDLEVCLLPEFMEALESDQEFMSLVSSS